MTIRLAHVRTVQAEAGETLVYVGRGRAPGGMEHAHLGNPFRVGSGYGRGEAAAAYLPYLRHKCREQGREYAMVTGLAKRLAAGEHLVICCWCAPQACHGEHVITAVKAYARQYGWTG